MKTIITAVVIIFLLIIGYIYLPRYRSAFEADQACHFDMSNNLQKDNTKVGCDHDIETRQWILYESGSAEKPAMVLKRFSY